MLKLNHCLFPLSMKISSNTFEFLKEIKTHNDRVWFLKNKARYEAARKELHAFAETWFHDLASFDESLRSPEEKPYVFRIYRDARFAKGQLYKTHFGILVCKGGRRSMDERAGYYLHVEPGKSFLAGGCYQPSAPWLTAIREHISKKPNEFKTILSEPRFKKYFQLGGEKLKTAPKGYSKDHPQIELLRHKSFIAMHPLTDEQIKKEDFLKHLHKACQALYPFDHYLNQRLP